LRARAASRATASASGREAQITAVDLERLARLVDEQITGDVEVTGCQRDLRIP
jgi:hypothetical protein